MCTVNELSVKCKKLRHGPPTVVVAYKALWKDEYSFSSAYQTHFWKQGWNLATNPLTTDVYTEGSVEAGAIHVALTLKRALKWLANGRCNAIIEVQICSSDVLAIDRKGECAVAKVYVPKLKDVSRRAIAQSKKAKKTKKK